MATDAAGDVYIADTSNEVVEKITPAGVLSIVAGTGTQGYPMNGPATSSPLNDPNAVAVDSSGNVYIGDDSNHIEKVTPSGALSIIAGNGTSESSSGVVPGPALDSPLYYTYGLAVDAAGNLYASDYYFNKVLKITPAGTLSVFAGLNNGTAGAPMAGPATTSKLDRPFGLAVDPSGNLYIGDEYNDVVEKVTPAGTLSVVAGTGTSGTPTAGPATSSALDHPAGVAADRAGDIYIGDTVNSVVEEVTPSGTLSILAGTGTAGTPTAGPASASALDSPSGVATDAAGNVYIADTSNHLVEKVAGVFSPGAPTPGTPTVSGGSIVFPWSTVSGATSYTVTIYVNGVPQTPITGVTGLSYTLTNPIAGASYSFTVAAVVGGVTGPASALSSSVTGPSSAGYWTVGGDGGVFSFGPHFYGSTGNLKLNQPVVAMTSTADGQGYWFVAKDGGVFSYGDAAFHGSVPAVGVHVTNIVGMATDTATGGYWLVGSDGGVYAFGAPFDGSIPGLGQHLSNIVGIAATADGGGYYLVTSTGAVYAFGDAKYQGGANTLPRINAPIVGITLDSATGGYWLAGSDGGIYAFGAPFEGSAGGTKLNAPIVGISATTSGSGYYLVASDGGVFSYNAPFLGSMGGKHLNAPMAGITVAG
jgi:sugar lactone lactonase YvrE